MTHVNDPHSIFFFDKK